MSSGDRQQRGCRRECLARNQPPRSVIAVNQDDASAIICPHYTSAGVVGIVDGLSEESCRPDQNYNKPKFCSERHSGQFTPNQSEPSLLFGRGITNQRWAGHPCLSCCAICKDVRARLFDAASTSMSFVFGPHNAFGEIGWSPRANVQSADDVAAVKGPSVVAYPAVRGLRCQRNRMANPSQAKTQRIAGFRQGSSG